MKEQIENAFFALMKAFYSPEGEQWQIELANTIQSSAIKHLGMSIERFDEIAQTAEMQ